MNVAGRFVGVVMLVVGAGMVLAENASAQEPPPKDPPSEKSETPSGDKAAVPTADPAKADSASERADTADTDAPSEGADSAASSTSGDAAPPEVASEGQAEKAESSAVTPPPATAEDAVSGDTSGVDESESGEGVDAETVVAAPVPVVQISPAKRDAEAAMSVDKEKFIQGTWTKSLLFATPGGSFRFQPRGWVQPRFRIAVDTEAGDDPGDDREPLDGTGFGMQRARFGFQAWLYDWGRFYLDTGWKSGTPQLVDYFIDIGPKNGAGPVGVRIGFFRPYFVRQLLTATTKLAMIDYAMAWTDSSLDLGLGVSGRQLGIGLQGVALGGLEYGLGLWNGSDGYDVDADFMYGGRLAVHPLGLAGVGDALMPGDESQADKADRVGLSIGAALYLENRNDIVAEGVVIDPETGEPVPFDELQLKTGVDVAFKYAGLSVVGEFFFVRRWADAAVIRDQLDVSSRSAPGIGAYLQIGYMALQDRFELVGRFDMVDENTSFRGIRFYPSVGATVFVYGNNLKVQTQYRVNAGTNYGEDDPDYIPLSHDILFMIQASI